MQSDIMDLQNTVWKLMAKQQEQAPRRGSPDQAMRPVQPGAKATALQPLEDLRLRPRNLTQPHSQHVRQQAPQQQQTPDGLQSSAAAASDKQL